MRATRTLRVARGAGAAVAAATVVACAAAASAPGDDEPAAGPTTVDVSVDTPSMSFPASFALYFPSAVAVHPGDRVRFSSTFTGEPHTVTLGTLVEQSMSAAVAATESPATPPSLPRPFPPGDDDVDPAAAQPCFLAAGEPRRGVACPRTPQPAFDGRQAFYSSGWLADDEVFEVPLSPDIEPGHYSYVCLTHPTVMTGTISVVAADAPVPSSTEQRRRGEAEAQRAVASLEAAVAETPLPAAFEVQAGLTLPSVPYALASLFRPAEITVRRGEAVEWHLQGPHTVSFDPPAHATPAIVRHDDGSYSLNETMKAPTYDVTASTAADIRAGSYAGHGFHNSGLLEPVAATVRYTLRFTRKGTYHYSCLLHPGMVGTVTVT